MIACVRQVIIFFVLPVCEIIVNTPLNALKIIDDNTVFKGVFVFSKLLFST